MMMKKTLKCGSVIPGCEFVVHAEDNGELLVKTAEHARAVHGIDRLSDQLTARILANSEEAK
jgi:predicted small metal-binding protein